MSRLPALNNTALVEGSINMWEQQVEDLPQIKRLSLSDHDLLKSYLQGSEDLDSYLSSPIYYLFTGRRGLWSYADRGHMVFFCWHPNCDGQLLVFPPIVAEARGLLRNLLDVLPPPPQGLRLARVKTNLEQEHLVRHLECSESRCIECTPVCEDVLDWHYPVRILSTSDVTGASGIKFRNVRKGLIHCRKYDIQKQSLNLDVHRKDLKELLHRWAEQASKTEDEYLDLYQTYDGLFALALDETHSVHGLVYSIDGQLQAVSLWEMSGTDKSIANLYANFCIPAFDGLAEFTIVSVCEALQDKGIDFLNLGGSETQSLDFFKNKFRPVTSIDLCSIEIKLGPETLPYRSGAVRYG